MVVHARPGESGILKGIEINPEIKQKYVKVIDMTAKEGDIGFTFYRSEYVFGRYVPKV